VSSRSSKRQLPVTQPVALVVVAVEELTSSAERFRCPHYHAVLRAGDCLSRQETMEVDREARRSTPERPPVMFLRCADCPTGRTVAARLSAVVQSSSKHFAPGGSEP
jgi:hypothetical protein